MTGRTLKRRLLAALLIAFAATQVFPLVWVASYSLQKSGDLFGPELLRLPAHPMWSNYVRAFTDGKVVRYGLNSALVVTVSTLLSAGLAFMLAYAIARLEWRLKAVALSGVVLAMTVPIHTTLLPNFIWFGLFGLIDTYAALVIPYVVFTLSFNTLVYAGALKTVPRALEEAALMDGAGWPRILWQVVEPAVRPATVTVLVMTFLTNWNEFIMANTYLATDDLRTIPFSVIRFQGQYASDYAVQFACMVLVALPPLALYLVFSKQIMAGATAGAVKG